MSRPRRNAGRPGRALLGMGLALGLTACALPPAYRPAAGERDVGYRELAQADDRYQVSYAGDHLVSRDRAGDYALLRAAELTLELGRRWFEVLHTEVRSERALWPTAGPYDPPYWGGIAGHHYHPLLWGYRPWWPQPLAWEDQHRVTLEIRMGQGAAPPGERVHLAEALLRALRQRLPGLPGTAPDPLPEDPAAPGEAPGTERD